MNKEDYQNDLLVLALATGFKGFVKDGKSWIMTIHKGQSMLFMLDFSNDKDIFGGNSEKILEIIDERLGFIGKKNCTIEDRYKTLLNAFSDEKHKFWNIAKQNLKKGD